MADPTMGDIVNRALKRLRVSNPRETIEAIDLADGLQALNDMMHSWKANGVDTDHETLTAADDFPLDEEHVQGVTALLAVRLAGDYGTSIDAGTERDAAQGWDGLQAEFFPAAEDAEIDLALRRTGRFFW